VQVIPAIDLAGGRSRVVFWPGASSGVGAPTDRPERIVERFVADGARIVHLVDVDGARAGSPANLEAVGQVAARVAVPIQVAGGFERGDHIRLAFAAGATRVVLAMSVADDPETLADCLAVAGDWLAPTFDGLVAELAERGVRRLVLTHGADADLPRLVALARSLDVEVLVAGGIHDLAGIRRLRDVGVGGVILGEALLSGAIEYPAALEAAA
jgi:phosphoribosylformimino-5-aminoimidazole carboxamide ribotide isomerase